MKRTFYLIALCALLGLGLGTAAAYAQPDQAFYHIVTTVCEDAASAVTVNYHSRTSDSYVLYTVESDTDFAQARKAWPMCQRWSSVGIKNTAPASTFYTQERYVCYATLSGLEADTAYRFKIVSGAEESDVRTFRTAGQKGSWNFVAFTDFQHRENPVTLPLIRMMKEIAGNPALMLCSGDHMDVAGNEYEWTYLLDNDVFRNFVYAASPGDHAYWACDKINGGYPQYDFAYTFNRLFHFPQNGAPSSRNTTYYFYYNNILFVALDMNNSDIASGTRFDDQARWFCETLDRLAGTYQYLVVYEHKSIFGSEEVDPVVARELRPQWFPIFRKYRVDLVLSGHDHIYSRTLALDGDQPAKDPSLGTYYLDMGSSGDKRRPLDPSLTESTRHAKVLDLRKTGQSCACNIEVSDTQMKVTVYDQTRQVVDGFTIPAKQRQDASPVSKYLKAHDVQKSALGVIKARTSIRSFTGAKLTEEQINILLDAAMAAPTAVNIQPWRFVVITDDEVKASLYSGELHKKMVTTAGAVIIVCGETLRDGRPPKDNPTAEPPKISNNYWYEDCSAATENLLLAATALDLGAVWLSCYPSDRIVERIKDLLGLPEDITPLAIVPVGYPLDPPAPKDKWKPENIHYNKW